jgi:DNA polymerase-1
MNYRCITTLAELKAYFSDSTIIAFDLETAPTDAWRDTPKAAFDPFQSEITGVSFSVSEGTAVYVPLRHRIGSNADAKGIMAYLAILLADPRIIKVAHNLSFEAMFLYHLGIVIQPPCYDTIAAAQMTLKSNTEFRCLSDSGLKTLVPELFDVALSTFEEVTGGRHFDELDPQEYETVRYACADSDYTLRLYHTFNTWFDYYLPRHRYLVEQVESPTAIYCGLMKHNGLPVDHALMLEKQQEADSKLTQLRQDIAFLIGDVNIGANAGTSVFKQYLFTDLKLPVLKTTAKYQEAADDETLILLTEYCMEHRPELVRLFELVQEYRKWGKLKSTYIDGYPVS